MKGILIEKMSLYYIYIYKLYNIQYTVKVYYHRIICFLMKKENKISIYNINIYIYIYGVCICAYL